MSANSTRTTDEVAMMLRRCFGGSPAPTLPTVGSVDRESVSTTTPTAKHTPPASMPAAGKRAAARAMEAAGPTMKATSSMMPS